MPTWRYLLGALRHRGWLFAVTVLLYIILYTLGIVPALVAREILNLLSGDAPAVTGFWGLVALLTGVHLVQIASWHGLIAAEISAVFASYGLVARNLLARILALPGARSLVTTPAEAIGRFRDDIFASTQGVFSPAYNLIANAAFALVALAILVRIDAWLTAAVFLPLTLVVAVATWAQRWVKARRAAAQAAIGQVTRALGDVFGAALALKLAGVEEHAVRYVAEVARRRGDAALRDRMASESLAALFGNLGELATGAILLIAAEGMRGGELTVGDFALFVACLPWATRLTVSAGQFLTAYHQAGISVGRLAELLQGSPAAALVAPARAQRPAASDPASAVPHEEQGVATMPRATSLEQGPALVEVRDLSYRHEGSGRGIAGVSFTLPRGSFTVVTGRVGSGKTTLLRALLGLLPADAGTIWWEGRLVADPAAWFIPPRSAYTPQVPRLFSDTLRENILLGIPEETVDLQAALWAAVLDQESARPGLGLDTELGPRGTRLSGGQVQRAAAARMLVRRPALLICDDLSSALDVETERLLWERLSPRHTRRTDGRASPVEREPYTFLVVSHRPALLRRADQIIVLRDGQVDAVGRPDELLATSAELRLVWSNTVGDGAEPAPPARRQPVIS